MIHAHFSREARDCDGLYSQTYITKPGPDCDDLDFIDGVVSHVVNAYSLFTTGTLRVKRIDDDTLDLEWYESTEEGFIAIEARICRDDCDLDEPGTHRDHTAELAGY